MFEDFNELYDMSYFITYPCSNELVRTPCPSVSAAMAWRSLRLEKFFASFVVEAEYFFFKARKPDWTRHRLKSLSLTSRHLRLNSAASPSLRHTLLASWHVGDASLLTVVRGRINDLLVQACSTVLQMPYLETMEIWNGAKRDACVF